MPARLTKIVARLGSTKGRLGFFLQVYLSALSVRYYNKGYINPLPLPFLLPTNDCKGSCPVFVLMLIQGRRVVCTM